jgi:hypothetical protein
MITTLCDQLLKELEIARSPLLSHFQPGISRRVVNDVLGKNYVKLKLPDEVYLLYQWRNGLNDDEVNSKASDEVGLFNLATFPSLKISIQNYQGAYLHGHPWFKGLFPLFDNGLGDFYLIDTDKGSDTYKMIMFYSPLISHIAKCASIFDSLDSCLITVAECYRKRAYYYTPDSPCLKIDPKLELSIWERNNPKSEYYKILKK